MRADDVVALVDAFGRSGIDVWLDGGWGIDALLGGPQRAHADLDLALPTRQWASAIDMLEARGFATIRDDGPYNQVLLDDEGLLVDLHAFDDETTVVGEDGVERHGPNGLAYITGGFGGRGVVAGRAVRCMTAEFQMWSHTGYEPDADDFHDVERLHIRFGLPIPNGYEAWLDPMTPCVHEQQGEPRLR
jgi:lincosamide nucleotidyltransferase A/C/D/E